MKNKQISAENYLITHVNVVDVVNDTIIEDQNIYVEKGIITYIGQEEKKAKIAINGSGNYLSPGLVNLHVHLFGSGKPSKTLNGKGGSQKLLIKFIHTKLGNLVLNAIVKNNLRKQILSGTTTLRSLGDFLYSDTNQRDKINNKKYIGPTVYASGPALTVPGGHGDGTISVPITNEEDIIREVDNHIKHKVDEIKITLTGGVMDGKRGEPGKVKMSEELVKLVVKHAHKNNLIVAAHVESTKGMAVAINAGIDSIEHGAPIPERLIDDMKEKNISLTTTISPAYPFGELGAKVTSCTEDQAYNAKIVSDDIIAASKQALSVGIKVGLGTDASCPYAFQYNTYREMQYFVKLVEASKGYAIKTMTLINASILHKENEIGSIELGKKADMLILSLNPYEDLNAFKNPVLVSKGEAIILNPHVKKNEKYENILEKFFN